MEDTNCCDKNFHVPVMLNEVLDSLNIKPDGIYIDLTFGGGGHSKEILKKLKTGHLYSFDQDSDTLEYAENLKAENFTFTHANAIFLKRFLKYYRVEKVDGIFADLGVSSHQIDTASRGFSIRYEGPLDMRMNKNSLLTAKQILNFYSPNQLLFIFKEYGELTNAKALTEIVCKYRKREKFNTTQQLANLVRESFNISKNHINQYLAKVFQSLRIEVNNELENLKSWLLQTSDLLKCDGRLVVLSYHSLEDRIVKTFIKNGNFLDQENPFFISQPILKTLNNKPLTPSSEELLQNFRSSSAKLRAATKIF
ncbi:MAG: 16S rRNA (cytosine(1402)-N(4))-methyltransferase RsmH [Cytophagales bacterium]|jgi:16S rRNA (cytosine1402-N4)-methyltransferase|nr:16S rRNA (cytosine(1402)-N(4))-methyltransferase RsmH [Cytophagales bacterium]